MVITAVKESGTNELGIAYWETLEMTGSLELSRDDKTYQPLCHEFMFENIIPHTKLLVSANFPRELVIETMIYSLV